MKTIVDLVKHPGSPLALASLLVLISLLGHTSWPVRMAVAASFGFTLAYALVRREDQGDAHPHDPHPQDAA